MKHPAFIQINLCIQYVAIGPLKISVMRLSMLDVLLSYIYEHNDTEFQKRTSS